ncbi:MAG: glycosyltransferase [Phycisphaerae bacterium]|nr:glycosyltransferase [Phycisphaerae bacterium]
MRVMLLVTDLERGGTPMRLARLARGLTRASVDVHVGCLAPRGPIGDELERDGIRTFACDARNSHDLGVFRRLSRHVRELAPDLIHATLTHANVAARLVGRRLGIPVLTSTATIEVERRWHLWLEWLTARRDAGHIVNTPALARHVMQAFGLPVERVHIVPPAIEPPAPALERADARRRLGLPENVPVIAWVGRLEPVKRTDWLVRCAEELIERDAVFALAGDGPLREMLERQIARSPARERVHLLGWQQNLAPLLSSADLFCLPSLTEGLPNAVLEAVAFGVPVLATNLPTLRDISGNGMRMRLVDADNAHTFASAIAQLLDSPDERASLASNARNWATDNLSTERAVQTLLTIYRLVLDA